MQDPLDLEKMSLKPLESLPFDLDPKTPVGYSAEVINQLAKDDPGKLAQVLAFLERTRHTEWADAVTSAAADIVRAESDRNEEKALTFLGKIVGYFQGKMPFFYKMISTFVPMNRVLRESYREATEHVADFLDDFSRPEDKKP